MFLRRIIVICLTFVFNFNYAQGQMPPGQYTSTNKKAIKYLEEGKAAYEVKKDDVAEKNLKKALEEDKNFVEAALGLANLYQVTGRHSEAITYFKKAIEINPKFFPSSFYFLALSQLATGLYGEAKTNLEIFLKFDRINPNTKESAQQFLVNAKFGEEAIKNPKPFKPVNVGQGINTENGEYFPAITGDGKQFMFTRALPRADLPGEFNEDFYTSDKVNNVWQTATPITNINSTGNEGAPTLSSDGNIMFFASCSDQFGDYGSPERKGAGSCDIFYSQKINGKWTRPRNAGEAINSANWETQPSFSSDGKTLYFIKGFRGRGGMNKDVDIYMSVISDDGKFKPAVKLNTNVNSTGNEESVFIHPDNMTLYFASDGHPGMGGTDLFMSKRQPNGDWGPAVNLGYPINTFEDENSLLVDPAGNLAYFASSRPGGFGKLDIYQFELPEDLRPEKITYVKGKIYNSKTKETLEASFELLDLETQQSVTKSYTQKNGEFFITLTANKNYLVNVNKDGFLFYSDNFSLKGKVTDFTKPFLLDIPLDPIDTGSVVELKNVFFDVNKWDLKPESKAELDKLGSFLTKNPTLKIELSGHTDSDGIRKNNITLSENRAKSVYDYLITTSKIDAARLKYKGYADLKPKVKNDTPENKARNRRTEFKVLAK
ncbi:MAG: PD40 domain-containing protein [Bacteroidetes bacterium]|nr:PD40 domain-containing protein [Bacteroidota bacterium]